MRLKFKIKGLDCANCAAELERKIQKVEGITEASISFMTERMIIECNDDEKDEIIDLYVSDRKVLFVLDIAIIQTRLIDGSYPANTSKKKLPHPGSLSPLLSSAVTKYPSSDGCRFITISL